MAKIHIEIDTHNADETDQRILAAIMPSGANYSALVAREASYVADDAAREALQGARDVVQAAKAKGGRPRKETPAPVAEPAPAPVAEAEPETAQDEQAEKADILSVNASLRRLIDAGTPTAKLKEVLLAATDGKYGSANHAANANDQEALNAIAEALKLLEG